MAQAVLGGLTVLFDLRPEFVMTSLPALARAAHERARAVPPRRRPAHARGARSSSPACGRSDACSWRSRRVVVFTGTIVTSTGPHGGDEEAKRFEFDLPGVARIHGTSVVLFLTLVPGHALALAPHARTGSSPRPPRRRAPRRVHPGGDRLHPVLQRHSRVARRLPHRRGHRVVGRGDLVLPRPLRPHRRGRGADPRFGADTKAGASPVLVA